MGAFAVLAESFRYPAPGRLEALAARAAELPPGPVRAEVEAFLVGVGRGSLEEWEELSARTLDLELATAPYLGYQVWGDKYQRSPFMIELQRAMTQAGVDRDGELPDHLVPVLRYLDACAEPLPRLLEVLDPALVALEQALRASDPENPYLHLVAGTRLESQPLLGGPPAAAGGRKTR